MMSLWDPNGTLTVRGNPNSPFVGFDQLKTFWLTSGSFTHKRFSLVPSFKLNIAFQQDGAFLYFECHDIGNYADPASRYIASDTFLATVASALLLAAIHTARGLRSPVADADRREYRVSLKAGCAPLSAANLREGICPPCEAQT
jgi:hypothetical protein